MCDVWTLSGGLETNVRVSEHGEGEIEGWKLMLKLELAVKGCSFHHAASTLVVPPSRSCRCVEDDGGGLNRECVLTA